MKKQVKLSAFMRKTGRSLNKIFSVMSRSMIGEVNDFLILLRKILEEVGRSIKRRGSGGDWEGKENTDFWDGEKGKPECLSLEVVAERHEALPPSHCGRGTWLTSSFGI